MAKPRSGASGKKPSKDDPRKEPKTPQDQKKAIRTHLENEMVSLAKSMQMEEELSMKPINRLLGVGGTDLDGFIGQITTGYKDIDPDNRLAEKFKKDKENIPFLKKVSKEEPWEDDSAKAGSQNPPAVAKSQRKGGKK
jgi:hypothetical protein